jgi:Cu(I)/Ag(I) efflux system membrane protein CusA/SilA
MRSTTTFARTRVLERLNYLGDILPAGVAPKLGPDATGLGWVYQYYFDIDPRTLRKAVTTSGNSARSRIGLSAINSTPCQAWQKWPASVDSSASTDSSSPRPKCAPPAFRSRTPIMAVEQSNSERRRKSLEENGMEFVVRGVGLVQNAGDSEKIVLKK